MAIEEFEVWDYVMLGQLRLSVQIKRAHGELRLGFVFSDRSVTPGPGFIFVFSKIPVPKKYLDDVLKELHRKMSEEEAETLLKKMLDKLSEFSREGIYIDKIPKLFDTG